MRQTANALELPKSVLNIPYVPVFTSLRSFALMLVPNIVLKRGDSRTPVQNDTIFRTTRWGGFYTQLTRLTSYQGFF